MGMTPVVFVIFNRPSVTTRVWERIREARPRRLFVIADGPRADRPGEAEKVAAARAVTENVDWPCEVTRDYSDVNLGCGRRVSGGITGVFEHVEEAIILEDDCLPHPSFFGYCTELLDRYRDDERVMCVSGDNSVGVEGTGPGDYFFSRHPLIWGWATWRRAWRHFDIEMRGWSELRAAGMTTDLFTDDDERQFWERTYDAVRGGRVDSWAYPWTFSVLARGGLATIPNANLVENIGFGVDATHTTGAASVRSAVKAVGLPFPERLTHPPAAAIDRAADRLLFERVHRPRPVLSRKQRLRMNLGRWRRSLLGSGNPASAS